MSKLEERVKEIIEENGGESFAHDVITYGCVSGIVPNLIYTSDAHEWYDEYYSEIEELRQQVEVELGKLDPGDSDLKTFLAWFSFEEITRRLYPDF